MEQLTTQQAVAAAATAVEEANKEFKQWKTDHPGVYSGIEYNELKQALKDAREYHLRLSGAAMPVETQFSDSISILMTPVGLCDWLQGSATNSSANLADSKIASQEDINAASAIEFPLAGREESLEHIADCFRPVYENRNKKDRTKRPIPICTGVPGLGKTRLMGECSSMVLDMTGIPGKRLSALISFGNDGNAYG
ncbi:hypothetical protein HDU84_003473 [Entophlyctis sp. JEL0112]|nr:hypothetical protein HDU84_003473 [Entophlyctis sp. JEL0112]